MASLETLSSNTVTFRGPGGQDFNPWIWGGPNSHFLFMKMHPCPDSHKKVSQLPSRACAQAQNLLSSFLFFHRFFHRCVGPHLCPSAVNQASWSLHGAQGSLHGDMGRRMSSHLICRLLWLTFWLHWLRAGGAFIRNWKKCEILKIRACKIKVDPCRCDAARCLASLNAGDKRAGDRRVLQKGDSGAGGPEAEQKGRSAHIKGEPLVLLFSLHSAPQEKRNWRLKWRFIQCFKSYGRKERTLMKDFSFQDLFTRNKAVARWKAMWELLL